MTTPTHRPLFPETLPDTRTHFCIACKVPGVVKVMHDERAYYRCAGCGAQSERFLAWDPAMVQYFNSNNELVHASVGVIVQKITGEVLLFKRVKYPFLWTIPAGHLEVGEQPHQAAIRELYEETNIGVAATGLIFEGELRDDSCVGGADIHYWHLYHTVVHDAKPHLDAAEGAGWHWFPIHALPHDMTYPTAYLLARAEIPTKRHGSSTV